MDKRTSRSSTPESDRRHSLLSATSEPQIFSLDQVDNIDLDASFRSDHQLSLSMHGGDHVVSPNRGWSMSSPLGARTPTQVNTESRYC